MPFKLRAAVRHHIPRQKFRITNWREYEAGLRNRGSLTVWFSNEAIAAWKGLPSGKQGGQLRYSELAIETALTLRVVFRLALRQCEGLIGSIMHMLGIDLAVPDHTTLSLRARRLKVEPTHLNGAKNLHLRRDNQGETGRSLTLIDAPHSSRTTANPGAHAATEATGQAFGPLPRR